MNKIGLSLLSAGVLLAATCTGFAEPVAHNQTTSGLIFSHGNDLVIRSEDIHISRNRIDVRYVVENLTDRDINAIIVFPLADIQPDMFDGGVPYDLQTEDFTVTIDKAAMPMRAERRALLVGVDVTEKLAGLGLSADPAETTRLLSRMPRAEKLAMLKRMSALGLASDIEGRVRWTYQRRFVSEQVLSPRKPVTITLGYSPSVASVALSEPRLVATSSQKVNRFCMDDGLVRKLKASKAGDYTGLTTISYSLDTSAGGVERAVEDFRVEIDKEISQNLLSFCGTGVKKTGPTTFEMRKWNYEPEGPLDILIITNVGD